MKAQSLSMRGFTLIELIIVITVMLVIAGGAIVNVVTFNQNQSTTDDAKIFITEMRRVYTKATGVYYPNGCTGLSGYRVSIVKDTADLTVTAECSSGNVVETRESVLKASKFSANASFLLTVPNGELSPTASVIVSIYNVDNATNTKDVQIDSHGVFQLL